MDKIIKKFNIENSAFVFALALASVFQSFEFVLILGLVTANYAYSRHLNGCKEEIQNKKIDEIEDLKNELEKVKSQVSALALSSGITKLK